MTCSVCPRAAVVKVDHHGLGRFTAYCRFHGYDRQGVLRWLVRRVETL